MSKLRSLAVSFYHTVFPALRRLGMDLSLRRNSSYQIVGVQSLWRKEESNVARGLIVEQVLHGHQLRFFVSDENDLVQQCHLMGEFYEERELAIIQRHYRGGTFVDVGANVGNHSLFAATVLNAPKVIAFEPNPAAFRILSYNVLLNKLSDRIDLRQAGLFSATGKALIDRSVERNLGATSVRASPDGDLDLLRGDDALDSTEIGFIKIDVETLEIQVLEGLRSTLLRCRPVLLVEVDRSNARRFSEFIDDVRYVTLETIEHSENVNMVIGPRP